MSKVSLDPSWYGRRLVARLSLATCFVFSVYALYRGVEMVVAVFPYTAGLAGWIISNYLGWSSYERVSGIPSLNTISKVENKNTTENHPDDQDEPGN